MGTRVEMQKESGEPILEPVSFKRADIHIPFDNTFQGIDIDDRKGETTIAYATKVWGGIRVGVMILVEGESSTIHVCTSPDKVAVSIQNIPDEACEDQPIPVFPQLSQIIS